MPDDLTLEDLAAITVTTMTIDPVPWSSQPARVSVFRREDMDRMGVADLASLLDLTPGFFRGVDVFGVSSLTVRGHWAQEGKVLVLLDDMPVNDLLYGSLNLSRRYPSASLDRVEIVSGTGTARYGGNAQLGVIRMYSRTLRRTGAELQAGTEWLDGGGWGWNATLNAAAVGEEASLAINGHLFRGAGSAGVWRDNAGREFRLGDLTDTTDAALSARFRWRDLLVSVFHDRWTGDSPQKFGFGQRGESVRFGGWGVLAEQVFRLSETFEIVPRVSHREQEDWFISRDRAWTPVVDFFLPAKVTEAGVEGKGSWAGIGAVAGVEAYRETIRAESPGGPPGARDAATYFNGRPSAEYTTRAAYIQADMTLGGWLASVGARHSDHSFAGSSLVPRTAVTWTRGEWRLKAVAGQAFREPNMEVINSSNLGAPPIRPEKTTHYEAEVRWHPSAGRHLSVSVYDVRIQDPIIYSSVGGDYYYANNPTVSSRGAEAQWTQVLGGVHLTASAAHYRAKPIGPYRVRQDRAALLGSPQWKGTLTAEAVLPWPAWRLRASGVLHSHIHAADFDPDAVDDLGNTLSVGEVPAGGSANLSLVRTGPEWTVSFGVDDLFASRRPLAQPYLGESTPYPVLGRRFWATVRLTWD